MAFFEQRKTGWRVQVRRRGMPSLSRTFDLKVDAENWAREIERELQRGNASVMRADAGKTLFGELVDQYQCGPLLLLKSPGKNRAALSAARERFGPLFVSSIRALDVARWRDDLISGGLAPGTAARYLAILSAVFSFAEKDLSMMLPAGNPAKAIRKPSPGRARDRRLRPGEMDYLLRSSKAARARIGGLPQIITLATETSMRLGELLGLEWERIDLKRRTAHLLDTKNGESRTVALSSKAVEALQSLPRRIDGRVFGWVASDSFEKTWTRCKISAKALYETECEAKGIKPDPAFLADLRFHDLRHEATSRLFEKGLGVMEVASMTGHKSLSMLKRYTHIEAEKLAKKLG